MRDLERNKYLVSILNFRAVISENNGTILATGARLLFGITITILFKIVYLADAVKDHDDDLMTPTIGT
jgi:hypothetical protein